MSDGWWVASILLPFPVGWALGRMWIAERDYRLWRRNWRPGGLGSVMPPTVAELHAGVLTEEQWKP